MQCDIVSARKNIYSGKISMLVVNGSAGELGITPRHAPLMTTLRPGPVRVIDAEGGENIFFVGGGILEVMPHLATVLADTAIRAADIDEAAAARGLSSSLTASQSYRMSAPAKWRSPKRRPSWLQRWNNSRHWNSCADD